MTIPTQCKMPTLSGIDSPLMNRLIVQLLVGEKGISQNLRRNRRNFIRYIDQAINEYCFARDAIVTVVAENQPGTKIGFAFEFTNHIEICINHVRRLYRLLDRIKSDKSSPVLPRELRRLTETKSQSMKDIRDATEHLDDRIQAGEVAPGSPIMLTVNKNEDGIVIADYEIKFKDLALVLEKMNEIAQYILTIKKVSS